MVNMDFKKAIHTNKYSNKKVNRILPLKYGQKDYNYDI